MDYGRKGTKTMQEDSEKGFCCQHMPTYSIDGWYIFKNLLTFSPKCFWEMTRKYTRALFVEPKILHQNPKTTQIF